MAKVLRVDQTGGGSIEKDFGADHAEVFAYADVALSAAGLADMLTISGPTDLVELAGLVGGGGGNAGAEWYVDTGPVAKWSAFTNHIDPASTPLTPTHPIVSMQFYRVRIHMTAGTPIAITVSIDGTDIGSIDVTSTSQAHIRSLQLFQFGVVSSGSYLYFDNIKVGTTDGATDIFSDDFESGGTSNWTSVDSGFTVITDPGINPAGAAPVAGSGRVLIAWDDGPLEPSPTWTVIDQGGAPFPYNFVSGYDIRVGRQTLISQTETGTATVYVNDREGLFDDRNGASPYQGKLSGRQIMLQLYNPVSATWEPQFRGLIDDYRYTMDGSAVGADGNPVNATVEIDCVDMFDYLNGYGLTPGVDGVSPPTGSKDSVYYAASGIGDTVSDRVLEILTDANIDPAMSILASGNVQVIETKYNPDESALSALRDAADAELPFIGNIYCNRNGLFCFRGRYSRFNPDAVAAAGSTWDFTRWPMGDGKAIQANPLRAQVRLLSYSRDRADLINAAMCYPQGVAATAIPDQVYADPTSITAYGKHAANPLTNLITGKYAGPGTISPDDGKTQCYLYAELLVKNKKDPRICPTAVQLKSINPSDFRASATWATLTRSDIGHIANIAVGYAGGTGLMGAATVDDYYIEGRQMTVRPANSAYDEVILDLDVSPFVWSADTHGVFPAFGT